MVTSLVDSSPKHTIRYSESFLKGKEQLGNLILKNMRTTGGTDVDWLVEHRGGFIILECKEFHGDGGVFPVSRGQMIAFEKLYERLNSGGKCYFYFCYTGSGRHRACPH